MSRNDVRQVLRLLLKRPAFAATVIVTLALGVGVNTAMFSVVNSLLLRPLPVAQPEQIVVLAERREGAGDYTGVSYPDLLDQKSQAGEALELAAYQISQIGLSADGRPERVMVNYVTGNFFTLLGLQPAVGRLIAPGEGERLGADPVLVLGYHYWQRRFNGDPGVVGRAVVVNGHSLTVIGVAPESFHGANSLIQPDAYMPLSMAVIRPVAQSDPAAFWTRRDIRNLRVVGRLRSGVSLEQAQAAVTLVSARLAREHAETNKDVAAHLFYERNARPQPNEANVLPVVSAFFLLLAGTVLLVACVNVANILLVRALGRQREFAVRTSLGAGRGRLIRESVVESMVLAVLGGVLGIALGGYACGLLERLGTQLDLPIRLEFGLDWRVFAYTFAVTLATGLFVGIVPALRASRANVSEILHEGGRSGTAGAWQRRLQNVLVVGQIAGSLVLLITAGLFVRSLERAQSMDLGFDPDNVVNLSMDAHMIGFDETRARAFYDQLLSEVRALPGVQSASLSACVPFGYVHAQAKVRAERARAEADEESVPELYYNTVDPGYFDNLRVALVKGRGLRESDTRDAPRVAVVNETMARRLWPDADPLGQRFVMGGGDSPTVVEVVGVVRDGKYLEPTDDNVSYFFLPLAQQYVSYQTLQVRSSVAAGVMLREIEKVIHTLAPELPTWDAGTMKSALNGINGLFLFRLGAALAAIMGLLGLVLAAVGLYGVVAYSVSQRSQEIGIRVALGARNEHILHLVLMQGLIIVAVGIAGGLLLAGVVGQVLKSLLVGVSPYDPLTFIVVSVLLVGVAAIANLVPAARALRVDPIVALRAE